MRIDRDRNRFHEIVRGKIRQNLRKYVTHGEMIGRRGKDLVSIPIPQLDVPRFRYGQNGQGGVGQGDGEVGQSLGGGEPGSGAGPAGSSPGEHLLEVEVTLAELAQILGEELQLPRIEPKGEAQIQQQRHRYRSIRRVGPESLRHFKRTYVQALRRQVSEGTYEPANPGRVVPIKNDRRYRSWDDVTEPDANAVAVYVMDVSGSMTDDQKKIVRTEAFWIDTWLRSQYRGVERRFIVHDAAAREVDEDTFYRVRESGGTRISSAYQVLADLLGKQFPAADWNVYVFQFSDGDNWGEDNRQALSILSERLLPVVNLFCYGQVVSPYGSGEYLRALEKAFGAEHEKLSLSEIEDEDAIYDSIKQFLGRGK